VRCSCWLSGECVDWLSWVQTADAVLRAFNRFCARVIDEGIGCERGYLK
jgi:hypothetical protein